ncbi:hypothetical protein J8F10_09895 [Gemmata sp. G18]|uniref:WD40 repeat domain-containing protein n=1 Tax=Gemmata palustris TaxID=2822762 RepID=A0ABS5BPF2_9BACT|nr:WD40 repeat domain-containing protein [Gemmata palustris]MBP3955593.1 hypothetical protein [Gemmata palustris]
MAARPGSWILAGVLSCGPAGLALAQKEPPVPAQPPGAAPKQPAKGPVTVHPNGLADGVVARLGKTRLRHAERPTCVAFAPDGKTFVTGGEDGTVRAWSVATGDQIGVTQRPAMSVSVLRYTHGGTRLAVHHGTETVVRLLDPKTLREIDTVPFPNPHRFGFSTDGTMVITLDTASNAVVSEVEGNLPKLELPLVDQFDFRPDGKAVAVGSAKGTVTVYLVTGGKPVFALKGLGSVTGLAYSPDGKRLAVGTRSPEGTDVVRIYAEKNGTPVAEIPGVNVPRAWLTGDTLAVGNGSDAGVYDFQKKAWAGRISGAFGEFAVSPDGTKLVATGNGGLRVRLWDLPTGKQMHAEDDSFPDPALMLGSGDGKSLFLLTTDTAYLWPVGANTAKAVGTLPGRTVSAAANGGTLAIATPDAVLAFTGFDPLNPLPAKPTTVFEGSAGAKIVAVAPDGTRVAWTVDGGKVVIADPTGKHARTELPPTTASVMALAFDPSGEKLAQIGRDGFVRLWSLTESDKKPKELWMVRIGRGQRAAIAFSPDGKLIAAASQAQVPVFNTADGSEVFKADRYSEDGYAHHAVFSPDSKLLMFGSSGPAGRVEVWELATRGLVRSFTTGYGGISRLVVFPDGKRAASAGAEEAVTVWDLTFRSAKPAPTADQLRTAWNDLESSDAAVGYPATKLLGSAGDSGTTAIARGAKEALATQQKIKNWVEELGSETLAVREVAAKELLERGTRAMPTVAAASQSENATVRDRALDLLRKMEAKGLSTPAHGLVGDSLRLFRAAQALEEIGTAPAQSVLDEIATTGGRPGAEAKAALARLKKK